MSVPKTSPVLRFRQTQMARRRAKGASISTALLGDLLVQQGHLSQENLDQALVLQAREDARLGDILLARNMVSRLDLLKTVAAQYQLTFVDLRGQKPDPRLMHYVDPEDCLSLCFVPWRIEGGTVVLAVAHPDMIKVVARKLPSTSGDIRFVLADRTQIQRTIHRFMGELLIKKAETRVDSDYSCRDWSTERTFRILLATAVVLSLALLWVPVGALALIYLIAVVVLFFNTSVKATCAVIALFRQHKPPSEPVFYHNQRHQLRRKLPKISILVPLYKEENIAAALLTRLERINYPRELLEICLIVEADDPVTRLALKDATLPDWLRLIRVPQGALKTKPRAMNYAVDFTTGSLIGVYDAEDAPDPGQLYKVARKFHEGGPDLACVQGILSFYNGRKNWLSRCFAFEYAAWFRVMLPGLQRIGFALPLGGTTLFFRRDRLLELGAWDAHNVTEDADLGMRLARKGFRCEMIDSVTQEEANSSLWPWVKQRSRWLKGYAVTWCVHMREPRQLLRDLGLWKFLGFQILFLGTLSAFFIAPVLWWGIVTTLTKWSHPLNELMNTTAGFSLMMFFLACETLTLLVFAIAAVRLENRPAIGWILTLPAYFVFGSVAAYKGLWELLVKPFYWEKTTHGTFGGVDTQIENSGDEDLPRIDHEPRLEGN